MHRTSAVTIRDVAREAGVSVATVSRALNDLERVTDVTRARVRKVAERLGYAPHGGARSLITRRTGTLGVLLPDLYGEFFSEVIRGIDQTAQKHGFHMLVASSHSDAREIAAAVGNMRGRVDGFVVMSPDTAARAALAGLARSFPTVIVGGGNSAMDAARWAKRMGSQTTVLYRRGRAELKARLEEIEHAEEEGIHFEFLAAPVALFGDEAGTVKELECIRMELGEPDESGRRSPVPVKGSEYRIPVDTVVAAIGQAPNPTLQKATPQLITKRGKVVIDDHGETSMARVYAGGDVVRGGSTVILAMKDGRAAAQSIHAAISADLAAAEVKQ